MQKNSVLKLITITLLLVMGCFYLWQHQLMEKLMPIEEIVKAKAIKKMPRLERKKARAEYFQRLMRDPVTNRIPAGIRQRELRQAKKRTAQTLGKSATVVDLNWREVGPTNVGGRTRALAIDQNDSNLILAGGVDGGLWKSTNGGTSWMLTSDQTQNSSVTSVAQDPQNPTTWYFTTGEFRSSSFDDQQGLVREDVKASGATGIFKSTDNGDSWIFIPFNGTSNQFPNDQFPNINPFSFTSKVLVHPTTGDVFVVTNSFGIFRSQDGGTNFTSVLSYQGNPFLNEYNDLVVTNTGRLVASIGGFRLEGAGIYISNDNGSNWGNNIASTTFFDNSEDLDRTVLAITPSNPDIFYAFAQIEGNGLRFFRFNRSTNAETNLSSNLHPQMNTQGSYNMVLAVHPTDPNVIIIGGVSLFRSTDGMTSPLGGAGQNLIGGAPEVDSGGSYPNSHTDNHSLAFDPTNPNILLNGNDGGIKKTGNVQANTVVWESLNNGYNVTQYYVGVTKILDATGKVAFVAGAQDNGSQYMETTDCNLINEEQVTIPPDPVNETPGALTDLTTGDGSFCAIGDNFIFASAQSGSVVRLDINGSKSLFNSLAVEPDFTFYNTMPYFIQPFTLDPNNEANGYMAAQGGILRNTNLALTGTNDDGDIIYNNWDILFQTANTDFSTAKVSESPADRLYAATYNPSGLPTIYRFDNASTNNNNTPSNTTTNISGMSAGSWVNEIEINPTNADEILVVISNYSVESLFYSTDGGNTFTAVQGNLGTDGPSVRDAEITTIDGQTCYFVGTTTGVYATNTLSGNSTQWIQVGTSVIGNTIVSRLDFDQTTNGGEFSVLSVATHGRGMFAGFKTPRCGATPVADFTPNMGNFSLCNGPVDISFTDASTNNPTTWSWTFAGAGVSPTTSTDQNPMVTVSQAGMLTVTLTASNDSGTGDPKTYTYTVATCTTPVAEFTPNMGNYSLCNGPVDISFTDASTNSPTAWSWAFAGAGVSPTTSNDQNPMVTVSQAGMLTVTLTASNDSGTSDPQTYTYTVEACALVAAFTPTTGDFNLCNGATDLNFMDTSTGNPTTWSWTFSGAGVSPTNATDQNPTVTVTAEGLLTATLMVSNGTENDEITYTYNIITCTPPTAAFTPITGNYDLCNGTVTIDFTDTSTGGPTAWSWAFSGAGVSPTTSNDQNPTITASNAGTLAVTLTVSNSLGNSSQSATYDIDICSEPCDILFDITFEEAQSGVEPIYYNTATIVLDGTPPYDFDWQREGFVRMTTSIRTDGKTQIVVNYATNAFWQMDIEDAGGCKASINPEPGLRISALTITPTNNADVTTGSIAINVVGGTPPYVYEWNGPIGFASTAEANITDLSYGWYSVYICDSNIPENCISNWFWVPVAAQTGGFVRGKFSDVPVTDLATYPNPFEQQATIAFSVPSSGTVNIAVYSLTGQKVMDLFTGVVDQGERYTTTFEAGELTAGIYVVQLTTEDGTIKYDKVVLSR